MRRKQLVIIVLFNLTAYASMGQVPDSGLQRIDLPRPIFKQEWMQKTAVPVLLFGGAAATWGERKAVRELRNRYIPTFRHHFDDYLQYVPAATVIALNAAGVKGKNRPQRTLVSYAFSAAIMGIVVNSIKYTAKVERPDGSARNSFPSGHTANSFMNATLLHKEYGQYRHPLYSVGAYSLATATAVGRQLNNRHWISDVLAGAGIGLLSTQLGYYLADKIYQDKKSNSPLENYRLQRTSNPSFLEMRLGYARLSHKDLGSVDQLNTRNGFQLNLQGAYFLTPHIGVGGEFGFFSFPVNDNKYSMNDASINEVSNGYYVQPFGIRFIQAGPYFSLPILNDWFLTAKLTSGISHAAQGDVQLSLKEEYQDNFQQTEIAVIKYDPGSAFSWSTGMGIRKRLGRNTALTANIDYFSSRHTLRLQSISSLNPDGSLVYEAAPAGRLRYHNISTGLALTVFLW